MLQLGRGRRRERARWRERAAEEAAAESEGELDLVGRGARPVAGGGAGRERGGDRRGAGPLRETRREMGFRS